MAQRVVINEALIFLRQSKRLNETDIEKVPDIPEEEPPDTSFLSPEQAKAVIDQLPDGYRAVFNLYAIEGKSHKEIAEMLHIKPDTSASQYHRAKNMLAGSSDSNANNQYDERRPDQTDSQTSGRAPQQGT